MRPERFWAQSCAERKKNAIRKDMIRERDNATKDYDCGDRDSPWKADGGGHVHSLTGDTKRARKNYYSSPTPPPNMRRISPREGNNIATTSPHDSGSMGRGQQYDQWRGGWQEGQGGEKRSYGGGGVVQCNSSSSMDEIMRGRPQNRDVSNMKSGREHSGSGYVPPPPNGIGVGGVRLHNIAGYDSGLRDGGGRNVDQYIPRRERKREIGEIVEYDEIPLQGSNVPIVKDYASLASEGSTSDGLIGLCHGSSFQGKTPRSRYGGGGSMVTLKERAEKEDGKERWSDKFTYPCEREESGGEDQSSSSHLHNSLPPSSLHHDHRVDSINKRSGFFHSHYKGGGGGLGRGARSSRWEGEYHGGGELQSSFHSSHRSGSGYAQRSGNISLQHKSHQSSSQQKERIGYNAIQQQQGNRDSIICEATAIERKAVAEDGSVRFSGGHEKEGRKEREWNGGTPYRRFDDGRNNMYKNEVSYGCDGLDGPISTTAAINNSEEMLQLKQQHNRKEEECNKIQHKRAHTDPVCYDGMILRNSWNTTRGDGGSGSSSKRWSQSGSGGELGGDVPPPFQTLPKPPPIAVTDHHSGVLSSSPSPSTYCSSSSSRIKLCSGTSNTSDAVVVPNELVIQEQEDVMRMSAIKPPLPCNQDPLPLPPAPRPEIKLDLLDEGRIELRSELDKYLICEMQYQEVSFYFKVLGRRIEKLLMSH